MTMIQKTFAIALTAATVGLTMGEMTTTADASIVRHGPSIGHSHVGHFNHFRFHARIGFRFHSHYSWHYRFHYRYARWHSHCWAHRWCAPGYRIHYSYVRPVVQTAAPAVAGPVCPAGTHLGYAGKYCWPNR